MYERSLSCIINHVLHHSENMKTRDLRRHSPYRTYCMFHHTRDKSALNTRAYSVICYSSFRGSTARAMKYAWEIIERCQKRKQRILIRVKLPRIILSRWNRRGQKRLHRNRALYKNSAIINLYKTEKYLMLTCFIKDTITTFRKS